MSLAVIRRLHVIIIVIIIFTIIIIIMIMIMIIIRMIPRTGRDAPARPPARY